MSTVAKISLIFITAHQEQRRQLTKKCKLKKRITYRSSSATAPKFDWGFTCTQEYIILELKNKECKMLNSTAIASGYAGRDPQGGTSDESFLVSSLLGYKEWLKIFF